MSDVNGIDPAVIDMRLAMNLVKRQIRELNEKPFKLDDFIKYNHPECLKQRYSKRVKTIAAALDKTNVLGIHNHVKGRFAFFVPTLKTSLDLFELRVTKRGVAIVDCALGISHHAMGRWVLRNRKADLTELISEMRDDLSKLRMISYQVHVAKDDEYETPYPTESGIYIAKKHDDNVVRFTTFIGNRTVREEQEGVNDSCLDIFTRLGEMQDGDIRTFIAKAYIAEGGINKQKEFTRSVWQQLVKEDIEPTEDNLVDAIIGTLREIDEFKVAKREAEKTHA